MAYESFEKVEGIIREINRGDDCCAMMVSVISDSNRKCSCIRGYDGY